MERGWVGRWRWRVGALLGIGVALLGLACAAPAAPSLRIVQPAEGTLASLSTPIELQVAQANLDEVRLERLDDATIPAPALVRSADSVSLDRPLAPDARYRLTARASALPLSLRAPWDQTPPATVEQVREFATVRTPRLADGSEPRVLRRGEALTVRFSEPLAAASVEAPFAARGEIDQADPRLLRVRFSDLPPGEDFPLDIGGVVGKVGAVPGPDVQVIVQTPAAPEVLAVAETPADDSVVVGIGAPLALDWSLPLRRLSYRLGDSEATWSGEPTTRVLLPGTLGQGEARTLRLLDAETTDGGWLTASRTIELSAPAPLKLAAYWPSDGATGVTPNADPTFRFSEPIADRAAAEASIAFTPAVPGRFEWLAANRVRFLPDEPFPRETPIQVEVKAGVAGARGQSGNYLVEPTAFSFQTGKLKVIDVSLGQQRLTLLEDDQPIWSAAVATGVKGAETPPGTYQVQYKMPVARFRGTNPNGSRYDIPDVHWVLAFFEDYTIHGAYWRTNFGTPGSNGCISLTDANAKRVFDWSEEGTTIVVRR